MLDPRLAFSTAGALVAVCWLALALSLFAPPLRRPVWLVTGALAPGLIAIAYVLLLRQGWADAPDGGFGSIAAVRRLFASDAALAAGWLHYLAFDVFVGAWIARQGAERAIHPLLLLACLPLTFMAGPAGLLMFLMIRLVAARGPAA